jgi:glycosyltransferase involved in cell wall biosynthesis
LTAVLSFLQNRRFFEKKKMKLSVYIITLNEEKRLGRTLDAAKKIADEIVVVDSGSTDSTVKIADKYGANIFFNKWESYCKQKSFAEKKCSFDWVLMLDADEVLSQELIDEIINWKKKTPKFQAYNIKIRNMFEQDETPRRFAQSFNVVRLYNRRFAFLPPDLNNKDRVKVNDDALVGQMKAPIYHYCILNIEQAVAKYNLHSTELLKAAVNENREFSRLRLVTEFPRQFLRYYFLKRYFLLGSQGFTQAMILAYFRFLKIAKWFEWKEENNKQ